ncbi:2'-5' RNA ligase family protein [Pedobacter mendelii]|uniref:2'-5' RNA ligase n=1 Tax=Pedobacter mendelii TaxID=1908240 RepID=A0ABQ2BFP5_9SPHI|nr:2'-5' RNA ligase family protein [Pedobacter mendelii]GGI24941.1 2'-5' RNA ligase [Pedobacter mendelii]
MENLFLVCLIPPISIVEDVDEIRNQISEQFDVFESLKRPAHITLCSPLKISSLEQEKKFFNALENASYFKPFTQVLKNFKSFPQHTIYIDVEQSETLMKLQSQIKVELKHIALISNKDVIQFTPHLTIAFKDVKPLVYSLIMKEYKDKNFKRTFNVSGFSLYKHIDKKWRPYKDFLFKNPDHKQKPLSLFD